MSEEHGIYSGVVDIARNGVDEVIRLRALNAELVGALRGIVEWAENSADWGDLPIDAAYAALANVEASK